MLLVFIRFNHVVLLLPWVYITRSHLSNYFFISLDWFVYWMPLTPSVRASHLTRLFLREKLLDGKRSVIALGYHYLLLEKLEGKTIFMLLTQILLFALSECWYYLPSTS